MAALGESYGRGAMTNHWIDLKNANAHFIMGSNAVENHPIASYWIWKAKEDNNATIIHVDPRFTRTSAKADIYAPMRSGTDIVFLGGMVRWIIEKWYESGKTKYMNQKYVEDCTNALFKVNAGFKTSRNTANLGNFPSDKSTWDYQYGADHTGPGSIGGIAVKTPLKATTLDDSECVFQKLREQYSTYTPQMVQRICGTPAALFEEICEAYIGGTYADDKAGTMLYAMGWTQHTKGSQVVRAATLVQTLLGNIGVAGGGVDALRGWHNVQGATDHAFLFHILPGYNPAPVAETKHVTLGTGPIDPTDTYLKDTTPLAIDEEGAPISRYWWSYFGNQYNRKRYVVSNLKAWWPGVDHNTSWSYIPKRTGDCSYLTIFDEMGKIAKPIKGMFAWGTNPMVMGPDQNKMRAAMDNLEWLVVCDCFETETSNFWKRPGADPSAINTEVYFLPGAYAYEKEGSASNSGRLAQWRDKACDPPKPDDDPTYPDSGARDEVEILNDLGAAIKTAGIGDAILDNLAWPVGPLLTTGTLTEKVAQEINGYALTANNVSGKYVSSFGSANYDVGQQIANFFHLDSEGNTACGNWLYCGTYQEPTVGTKVNMMRMRDPVDYHPKKIGIHHKWGYSWPVNRRIIYNRASVYQSGDKMGQPLNPDKWVVWWNGTNWNGDAVAPKAADVIDGFGGDAPTATLPFIMHREGVARLMGIRALADGPFPEHWEPKESPLTSNPLTEGAGPLSSPYAYAYPTATYATSGDPNFPIVCTTFRLTEHWHGGGFTRNSPTQGEAQPEPFVEISEELAVIKGIFNGDMVRVTSARGSIDLKACVTKRWKPYQIDGKTIHQVGMPWHWGFAGMFPGATANFLTPFIGDANTRIPETKVFLVKVEKITPP